MMVQLRQAMLEVVSFLGTAIDEMEVDVAKQLETRHSVAAAGRVCF